ncbi:MAG: tetratricopeptide repeat protein [Candidatus Sulfotelmatobacter sp.]
MQRNLRSDPEDRPNSTNQPGVSVPAKGDSSGSHFPVDPDATLVDFPQATSDPEATLVDSDATLVDVDATVVDVGSVRGSPAPSSGPRNARLQVAAPMLQSGDILGGRYEILQMLGEGGMGAVYKARDRELDRFVALKLIRPELAANPSILARFKQELLLSREVTHRNVIRIYDLGDADGVKFITMEFVEGQDLRSLIQEKKKFPPEEAVELMQQVCRALEAAHTLGIIHRDLKPQNIMRDQTGRILVMDFGLARTVEGDGMTQTGALVGTMEYMSPEQALGKDLDQRSDLYSMGLILYELLTGKMPFKAESAVASLIKRNQEQATPVSDHDQTIPRALSNVVAKCLERDPNLRYQTAGEFLQDLEVWQGKSAAATLRFPTSEKPWGQTIPWHWIGGTAAVLALAIIGFLLRTELFAPGKKATAAATGPVVSLAILPFRNASGDPSVDWLGPSLADMLSTDVGQSARLHTVSPTSLHQVFTDLRLSSATVLDPATIRRVANFSNADRVVWGQYAKFGDQIRIDATLQDIKNDRAVPLKIDVPSEKEIPDAIDRLAESIRQKLALPEDVLKELKAASFQPSSKSIPALRDYSQGVASQREGKNLDAQKQFEAATKEDPTFALAFSRLAQTYSSLGYDSEAEQSAKKAVDLSQDLPEAEKYLISAIRFQATKNYPEAMKAYETLAQASPGNSDVQSALAGLYQDSGDLGKARDYYQKLLSANPKDIAATLEMGRIAIKSGDPQGSFDPLNRAYSLAVQVDNQEQKATSLHLMAMAYRKLSKPQEVRRNEQEAITIWHSIGQKRGLASSLNEMARAQSSLGEAKDASSNFEEALSIRREIGDKRGLGDTLIDMGNFSDDRGDHDQALKMYKEALELKRDIGDETAQASCLNNIGAVYSEKNQYEDALTYFQQVLQLREKSKVPGDIVDAVQNLGQVLASMGQYDQAISYFMRALDLRRSMNDPHGTAVVSYALGAVFDYQGRFGAAANSDGDAVKALRELKDGSFWMPEILGNYGEALVLAGRGDEAKGSLEEALSRAHELKNDGLVAQTLDFQGDAFFYQGNFPAARSLYQQSLQAANRSKNAQKILFAKIGLAEVEVREKNGRQAIPDLRKLIQQADDLSLKYSSGECSIFMGEAMMQSHDYAHARQELQRALLLADKFGQQPLSAHAHYLLATIARDAGNNTDAQDNYRSVISTLDTMKRDAGAEKLLQRSDLKLMYEDSSHWLQPAKS